MDTAATHIQHRTLRATHCSQNLSHLLRSNRASLRAITRQIHRRIKVHFGQRQRLQLHVLGNVHQHRTRTTRHRHIIRFLHHPSHIADIRDHVLMLGDRPADLHHRSFLEGITANHRLRDLSRDADHRDAVQFRVSNPRHQIGGTRAAGAHHHTNLPGGTSNPLGRKTAALLVTRQNRPNSLTMLTQGLMQRHAGTTRVGVNRLDTQSDQHLDQDLSTIDCLSCIFDGSQRHHPSTTSTHNCKVNSRRPRVRLFR